MLLKCTKLEKQARKNMQEISFEPYARLNLKYALLTPSICGDLAMVVVQVVQG